MGIWVEVKLVQKRVCGNFTGRASGQGVALLPQTRTSEVESRSLRLGVTVAERLGLVASASASLAVWHCGRGDTGMIRRSRAPVQVTVLE